MAVTVIEGVDGKAIEVRMNGTLTHEDYQHFVPVIEKRIEQSGKIRLLVILDDFDGWTAGAMWDDIKFDVKHFSDIERLAIVGETKWESAMATFCRPFTTAAIKYFDHAELKAAEEWISEESD
ncbi:SpoIIAA family protein [Calycomorphotria hydatis]|uniref:STAS/SEC14 domain-containing protein n=1 Tax=Calycomorphotria hydatis TaxID=2528027 RepID=A0A517TF74_9PLAN|nr:STAS/SEC14 domain-containing protein [Calycomorphotria hydatis]QDT67026.1 hypothetical protein V22_42980 [Calycomorphotria hydatis]